MARVCKSIIPIFLGINQSCKHLDPKWLACVLSGQVDDSLLPQVILLDTSNSPHLAHFCSGTNNLDSDVGLGLDCSIFVVGELRWCGIGIPLDITRN